MKSIYKITLLFLLFPLLASANNDDRKHEKTKKINKEYTVNANARISLDNKYGDLNITTWDKNRVEIEVIITVKGDDLDRVEEKLEDISVEFTASSNLVEAKTKISKNKSSWSLWKNNRNINYKINYNVKMPKSNSADLDNDYGNIYLTDLLGKANINCDYGKISVGNLSADNNNINLDYCSNSTIAYMKGGNVNVDYSKITIEDSETLKVNTDYSTVKVDKVDSINFNADYGSISIGNAINAIGNSDYTSMRLGTINKNLNIKADYGSINVKKLAKGFDNVVIDGQYTGIKIGVDPDAVFEFELNLQYAGFRGENSKMEYYKKISKNNKKYYQGKFGKGNSNSTINIESQYGGVSIKEY